MDFCYSGLKRGFRQIFFYFFYQFVAIEIFEDFDHASAYHRVHLQTELYSAYIGFEPVTPLACSVSDTQFNAGPFIGNPAVYIHKDNIRFSYFPGIQRNNHFYEFFFCLSL